MYDLLTEQKLKVPYTEPPSPTMRILGAGNRELLLKGEDLQKDDDACGVTGHVVWSNHASVSHRTLTKSAEINTVDSMISGWPAHPKKPRIGSSTTVANGTTLSFQLPTLNVKRGSTRNHFMGRLVEENNCIPTVRLQT